MIRLQSPTQSNNQINCDESRNWDNRSPNLGDQEPKKWKIKLDKNVPKAHFCNPIKQTFKEQIKIWPSCDPDKKLCDGGGEIYEVSKTGNLRFWYCSSDSERRNVKEIDKLADEYELGIGKKGHILDHIWEYCNQVHNKNYEWHSYEFKNEECEDIRIDDKEYHPPEIQVETFEVKKYSFNGGQNFICVTKDLDNALPLGRKNGSKFKEMIRNEVGNKSLREDGNNLKISAKFRNLKAMLWEFLVLLEGKQKSSGGIFDNIKYLILFGEMQESGKKQGEKD
ncbi:hypothetical protein Tco_0726972 [Tanacetum coccineum]|uniref:Uncharacterized protein n=1 Tax=Tanacetum coccineum TaxID=301880 RepID=A0ABQ4YI16_9ASTR